jgi:hypothetical protein
MEEHEIIKHTKKAFKVLSKKENTFWQRLKDFVIEILIIVFAVTLSIWLHSLREYKSEQKEVKQFLIGLRADLINDIGEMENDKKSYLMQSDAFTFLTSRKTNNKLNSDSLNYYAEFIFLTTWLLPNNGRFEGFKSSGKIGNIEDYELQNDILDLYQEDIPALINSTNSYTDLKKQLWQYIYKNHTRLTDSTTNIADILIKDEAQNICMGLSNVNQTIERYNKCITKMDKIIFRIDKLVEDNE